METKTYQNKEVTWKANLYSSEFRRPLATSNEVRILFAQILIYCDVSDPIKLWIKHWEAMSDDIRAKISKAIRIPNYHVNTAELKGYILYELEAKKIYHLIMGASLANQQELLFVYGHGGIGKTFLWKTVINSLQAEGKIVLAVASSGLASLLLPARCTAHSRFKLPLELTDESLCHRSEAFAKWLLDVGNGEIGELDEEDAHDSSWITIPPGYLVTAYEIGLSQLIDFIYDDTTLRTPTAETLQEK
nr:DNA helicase [Tanacetum cinerariifolium]